MEILEIVMWFLAFLGLLTIIRVNLIFNEFEKLVKIAEENMKKGE